MKKVITLILSIFLLFITTSCGRLKNNYIVKENGVDITIPSQYLEHFLIKENIPSLHFDYNGVRISDFSSDNKVIFVQNDQYALSDAFSKHISQYEYLVETKSTEREEDKKGAKLGKDKLPLDEGTKSLEKIVIATLSDGTRVSYLYRTFTSNGKTYYAYSYVENMSISMELPFMVVKDNNTAKLVLLPLPYDTKYSVGTNIDLDTLLVDKVDKYLNTTEEDFYKFNYPTYLKNKFTEVDAAISEESYLKTEVLNWYEEYCNLEKVNDNLYHIDYLGVKFSLSFGHTKAGEPAFKLDYIGLK